MPAQIPCPNCHNLYSNSAAIVQHLNDSTSCWACDGRPIGRVRPDPEVQQHEPEEDIPCTQFRYHPSSGYVFSQGLNIMEEMDTDQFAYRHRNHIYYPFQDRAEWELAKFLCECLTQTQIDRFMHLKWEVEAFGERQYGEFFTGWEAFRIQDELPVGATIVPIILGSDKMAVKRGTGNIEMHSTFLTIGNIRSDVRMKATTHAWSCVAFIPTPKFEAHLDYQGILQARVWHKCMDGVTVNLKIAAKVGTFIPDPFGTIRYVYTPLVAYQADIPKAQVIARVAKNSSPVSLATQSQFGDAKVYPPRTARHTLEQIFKVLQKIDPWKLNEFQIAAKEVSINGVHQPFWRNWHLADLSVFLTPELLHTCHKFFFDHVLVWCKDVLGHQELDNRYKS
ncbi:hypothetical protein SERLA73DRAFT_155853 [Serpula lacrymans var. lacrymans S7.3]|uniref:C2H2-type domain-containing protein n=1 Tax=Serpula lacrymans var. lacrymans (strain S7.3) TaxID=936435 RepID=F8QBV7_SERL3|nr:hypothetical protein SERLA73DRAFT_155853 [Serpula lacrymans var. lacrymans S7.3]